MSQALLNTRNEEIIVLGNQLLTMLQQQIVDENTLETLTRRFLGLYNGEQPGSQVQQTEEVVPPLVVSPEPEKTADITAALGITSLGSLALLSKKFISSKGLSASDRVKHENVLAHLIILENNLKVMQKDVIQLNSANVLSQLLSLESNLKEIQKNVVLLK
jgi:hypothetical protein